MWLPLLLLLLHRWLLCVNCLCCALLMLLPLPGWIFPPHCDLFAKARCWCKHCLQCCLLSLMPWPPIDLLIWNYFYFTVAVPVTVYCAVSPTLLLFPLLPPPVNCCFLSPIDGLLQQPLPAVLLPLHCCCCCCRCPGSLLLSFFPSLLWLMPMLDCCFFNLIFPCPLHCCRFNYACHGAVPARQPCCLNLLVAAAAAVSSSLASCACCCCCRRCCYKVGKKG